MTLHIVKDSPHSSRQLQHCLSLAAQNDHLLLIENAVYAISLDQQLFSHISHCYILKADLQARALLETLSKTVSEKFSVIDYNGFVELTEQHPKIISW